MNYCSATFVLIHSWISSCFIWCKYMWRKSFTRTI